MVKTIKQSIKQVEFALASLVYSLLMCSVTTVHHLHSALVLHPDGPGMHVVWIELVMIPATCLSIYFYLQSGNRFALLSYLLIAAMGFVFLGLIEGGWNHTGKLIAYLRIDSPSTKIGDILPSNNVHLWFYEFSGVLTFLFAVLAFWYSMRFYLAATRSIGS